MPPDPFSGTFLILMRYFWLVFLAVMLVNVAIWRTRLRELVTAGRATREEVDRFLRGAVVVIVLWSLAAEATILATGWVTPLCFYASSLTEPGVILVLAQSALVAGLLLWWVWVGRGADTIARLGPALFSRGRIRERPYSSRVVRAVVTLWVVAALVGLVVERATTGPVPGC